MWSIFGRETGARGLTRAHLNFLRVCFLDSDGVSDVVDIFDGKVGLWHTAKLNVARSGLSATSLPSQELALFAGGNGALLLK